MLLLPFATAHADIHAAVTLVGTMSGRPALFSAGGAILVTAEKDLGLLTVFGRAPMLLQWNGQRLNFDDLGISLGAHWTPRGWSTVDGVTLELFANNAGLVRPSFDWANVWGMARSQYVAPMARLSFAWRRIELWGALQARSWPNSFTRELDIQPSGFFGLASRLPLGFSAAARAALIDLGVSPGLADQGVRLPLTASGATAQLRWDLNEPVSQMVNFLGYASDPERFERFFVEPVYSGQLAASLLVEGGVVSHNLGDPDVFGGSKQVTTGYFDFQARVRTGPVRSFFTARVRPVDFVVFDVPGMPPYNTWPAGTKIADELTFLTGFDVAIRSIGLTAGASLQLRRPASFQTLPPVQVGNNPPPSFLGGRTVVVSSPTLLTVLPDDAPPRLTWLTSLELQYQLKSTLFILFELQWEHDPNHVVFRDDAAGVAQPERGDPNGFKLLLAIQARF
jgi:hypothetical protein